MACINLLQTLSKSVDKLNTNLINNMTNTDMRYELICVKPNITYDHYYKSLKTTWEPLINDFINRPDKCESNIANLAAIYDVTHNNTLSMTDKVANTIVKYISHPNTTFTMDTSASKSIVTLVRILSENCFCQSLDIFKLFMSMYSKKYGTGYLKTDEVSAEIREKYAKFAEFMQSENVSDKLNEFINNLSTHVSGLYSFSVEDQLDTLIPNELGSLKQFFITIISNYFNKLHPIVWAQILRQMIDNVFIDLPFTDEEIFRFLSKYTLLNSGPFILKILQLIRPVLSPELAKKYNLSKLTYPLLSAEQTDIILAKIMPERDMFRVLFNVSASVGNVTIMCRADNPSDMFVVKIIKPVAIAQSCWEYTVLNDIFPAGSCEAEFVKNMLESNGSELNVLNEIKNIHTGEKAYTDDYKTAFGNNVNMKITTIGVRDDVISKNEPWYGFAMTMAPGVALSNLIENDVLNEDTVFRAKLHRGLDLLMYKFFQSIIKTGFYHGDLHAGNIFFSYEQSQITLIDFGATSTIDIYSGDSDITTLLDVIVFSLYYDYESILDSLTDLLNTKCTGSQKQIDKDSVEYQAFRRELQKHHLRNMLYMHLDRERQEKYVHDIFSETRLEDEKATLPQHITAKLNHINSVYDYLKRQPTPKETIVENKDILPVFTEIQGDTISITFAQVLESIVKYYATTGINIAIAFGDFYEFQKAYSLLLGVLLKTGYSTYRLNNIMSRTIINWSNLPELRHLKTVGHIVKTYWQTKQRYEKLVPTVSKFMQEQN